MHNMADQATEEGKAKALKYYKILAVVLGVLGVGMLVCGIVATLNIDEEVFGPPYFIGGYTVGVMASFSALLYTCVIMKAGDASSDVKKQELDCAIHGHYMISICMLMGSFIGVFMAFNGFALSEYMSPLNENLAIVILLGSIFGLLVTIASMCTVCTYGKYVGVVITQGRRGRAVLINTNNATVPSGVRTNTTIFHITQSANDEHVSQLQMQNHLLKQQLKLQRQLNQDQQQKQQQQQYGRFSNPAYPPPPPMYPPPPNYEDVK